MKKFTFLTVMLLLASGCATSSNKSAYSRVEPRVFTGQGNLRYGELDLMAEVITQVTEEGNVTLQLLKGPGPALLAFQCDPQDRWELSYQDETRKGRGIAWHPFVGTLVAFSKTLREEKGFAKIPSGSSHYRSEYHPTSSGANINVQRINPSAKLQVVLSRIPE